MTPRNGHNAQKVLVLGSFLTEVEVPSEVVMSLRERQSAMLAITHFQTAEVLFQPVGGSWNGGIVKIGEHIR